MQADRRASRQASRLRGSQPAAAAVSYTLVEALAARTLAVPSDATEAGRAPTGAMEKDAVGHKPRGAAASAAVTPGVVACTFTAGRGSCGGCGTALPAAAPNSQLGAQEMRRLSIRTGGLDGGERSGLWGAVPLPPPPGTSHCCCCCCWCTNTGGRGGTELLLPFATCSRAAASMTCWIWLPSPPLLDMRLRGDRRDSDSDRRRLIMGSEAPSGCVSSPLLSLLWMLCQTASRPPFCCVWPSLTPSLTPCATTDAAGIPSSSRLPTSGAAHARGALPSALLQARGPPCAAARRRCVL